MPPLIRGQLQSQIEAAFAKPQRAIRALATGQQGGLSGQIPGTTSDPQQLAVQWSTIMPYPGSGPSPHGDQVAGVGFQVLNNAGNPVVVVGNLDATQTSGTDLPSNFQDGGFAFVDPDGNLIAGYSQPTGLWGFGGGVTLVDSTGADGFTASDSATVISADGALHNVPFSITSPPTWMDSSGNFQAPGTYVIGLEVVGNAAPTTQGLWCQGIGAFQTWEMISLDACQMTNSFGAKIGTRVLETFTLTNASSWGGWVPAIQMPTDATATLKVRALAWRLLAG